MRVKRGEACAVGSAHKTYLDAAVPYHTQHGANRSGMFILTSGETAQHCEHSGGVHPHVRLPVVYERESLLTDGTALKYKMEARGARVTIPELVTYFYLDSSPLL